MWVQASIDRYFFREPYSYQNTIRKLSREMSAILDLQSLLTHLSAAIGQTVNCETVDAYAKDFASPLYRRLASWRSVPDEASDAPVFDETSAIVLAMAEQRRYLLRDEILGEEARDARKELREVSADFAVPLFQDERLAGFFLLGPKRSTDPYFAEDIDLLTTLASQAAIAARNAELYAQFVASERDKRRIERLASVGALAAGIAHEIKNPLVAIKAFAELLPERFHDEEFRGEFADIAKQEIERIDELVKRLSGLAGPREPAFTTIDVRDCVEETLAVVRAQLQQAHVSVKTQYSIESRLVAGDRSQLKQLFLNLFMNAIEAMPDGGELFIKIENQLRPSGRMIIVDIMDTGKGVAESMLMSIFDPFVTTKLSGSGLGLSICRGIADAHRASIQAKTNGSEPGLTVTLEFPASSRATSLLRE
ncbi:MAG: hypothetical protein DMD81_05475 [Candidatus Rokuibacteriota bacterium]|nr:MAG: hypothetical protein DMD81_05475 [Candidatus Rokubacteria bacterium]